jgi:hypothetical protein
MAENHLLIGWFEREGRPCILCGRVNDDNFVECVVGMQRCDSEKREDKEMAGGNAARAIGMAGLACGVLDITAALVVYGAMGLKPLRLLQGIAAGVLGPKSFQGGMAMALLGMNRIVVPLSGATKFPFSLKMMVIGVVIHIFCVGLPIALSVRRFGG